MDFPAIISFYTKETPYEEEVQNLIESCEKFGLETSIEPMESQGSWELNCAYKPFFIYKKLHELQKPVLWVDADAVFLQKPTWQQAFDFDLALRIEDLPNDHPTKVRSGTIFVRPAGLDLIQAWIESCRDQLLDPERKEEFWDQIALRDVILKNLNRVGNLPLSYIKIFDHPGDCKAVEKPVIEHYQASRRYKSFLFGKK